MPIFEITKTEFRPFAETSFGEVGIKERADLQRLLRSQIDLIAPGTLVIAEEFGEWEDSKRRIDLLGLDTNANLVVIELKRTEDGGHMELQAIRYAAMISTMTFEKVIEVYGNFLQKLNSPLDPRASVLKHLGWSEPDEDSFAQQVRIVLASAEFSKELTTAVLWLNDQGLDIRCVRIKPYKDNTRVLVDIQPIIPLPEAQEFQVQIKEKQQLERKARTTAKDYTKYDITVGGVTHERLSKRLAIFTVVKYLCDSGVKPQQINEKIPWRINMFRSVDGVLNSEQFAARLRQEDQGVDRTSRYFCTDGELIHSGGQTFAFTNQWGNQTGDAIGDLVKAFPEKGIKVSESK